MSQINIHLNTPGSKEPISFVAMKSQAVMRLVKFYYQ